MSQGGLGEMPLAGRGRFGKADRPTVDSPCAFDLWLAGARLCEESNESVLFD
jgi:hypothetical protein